MKQTQRERVRGDHPVEAVLYEKLIDAITDKKLIAGQHLNEVKLAENYNVPRSRVRRVLERLQEEQVVVFELNRGAFVSRPTVDDAKHVFEAREHLECLIVRLCCEKAEAADIAALNAHLRQEEKAFKDRRHDVYRIAAQFHHLLGKTTHNPVIERMLSVLVKRSVLIQSVYENVGTGLCLTDEHRRIVDAIAGNRPDEAERETRRHFQHILSSLDLSPDNGPFHPF